VELDVVGSAEPSDVEGPVVVVVVSVCLGLAAHLAGLSVGEGFAGCQSCEDSLSVLVVAGVSFSPVCLDALGVTLVGRESVGLSVAGHSEVAAPLGTETAGALGWDEVDAAELAGSGVGHGSLSSRATKKKRDAPPWSL
jgi:hypothetical protein